MLMFILIIFKLLFWLSVFSFVYTFGRNTWKIKMCWDNMDVFINEHGNAHTHVLC